ncbi:MAG: hypothetical protein IKC93_00985 [Candidatus Methanomethylophilaceae archaeon]|nr:hypothetical protein [Candidatus Methanomethylophilaceae archaeon]
MNAKVTATIAVAVVALMVFAAAGSTTYSWFSDSEETDINITTAKVEISVSWDEGKTGATNGSGNTGFISTGALNGLAPGLSENHTYTINSTSTIDVFVKTYVELKVESGTAPYKNNTPLYITFDGMKFPLSIDEEMPITDWVSMKAVEVGTTATTTHDIVLGMDSTGSDAGDNAWAGIAYKLNIKTVAYQYNADLDFDPIIDPTNNVININTVGDLRAFATSVNAGSDYAGKEIRLTKSVSLKGYDWAPIGNYDNGKAFRGTFDGQGNTISDLYVDNDNCAGLFGWSEGNIKNVIVDGAQIKTHHYAGVICGYSNNSVATTIENCQVKNATIECTQHIVNGKLDDGDKVGGIIGHADGNDLINKCTVSDSMLIAFRDVGGIAGAAAHMITNCAVNNVSICSNNEKWTSGNSEYNATGIFASERCTFYNVDNKSENVRFGPAISTVDELKAYGDVVSSGNFKGKIAVLTNDIDLGGVKWIPIGIDDNNSIDQIGVFDGRGYCISNFDVNYAKNAGLFGCIKGSIKNLSVKSVTINSNDYAGAIVGKIFGDIENCHASDVKITVSPYKDGDKYDGGAKAGGVAGFVVTSETALAYTVSNCSATNVTIDGYRDLGGVVGFLDKGNVESQCIASDIRISYIFVEGEYDSGTKNQNAGAIVGRYGDATVSFTNETNNDFVWAITVTSDLELDDAITKGASTITLKDGTYDANLYEIAERDQLTIIGSGAGTKLAFNNLQVRASQFDTLTIENCEILKMPNKSWGHLVFGSSTVPGGVYTLSNCIFNGVGTQGIYINQNVEATFNIENCTFNGDFGGEGAITIQNNDNVNVTVNVTGCTFNNIPETSHKIYMIYKYDGFTLNADGVDQFWKDGKGSGSE